ncbi:MAG TPA: hypothetical protein EYP52_11310 [Anaerolineae bacterium]|nr:hypothetical protein [Anaerolineae bacterium]
MKRVDHRGEAALSRIGYVLWEEGGRGVARRAWRRLSRRPVYRRLLVVEYSLRDIPITRPRVNVTFGELHPSEFEALIALRPFLTEEVIRLRLRNGHRFYVARRDGRIVHSQVVAVGKAYSGYLEIAFPLAPDEVYCYEAYTVPEHRGKRLSPAGRAFIAREMERMGYGRALAFIAPKNYPAVRAALRDDGQVRGHIGFVEVAGVRRYFYRVRKGGFGLLQNGLLVPMERFVPMEIQGTIW